jgi:hypothetical protein
MSLEFRYRTSVLLNLLLAATVVAVVLRKSERALVPVVPDTGPMKTARPAFSRSGETKTSQYAASASESDRRRWIVDDLRAKGVPENVLARLVRSDLEESWDKRFEEVALKTHGDGDAMAALQVEKEKDTEAQMRAALGEEAFKRWDQGNMLREANIGKAELTPSESDAIYELKKNLQRRQWELTEARVKGGMDDAGINEALNKAYSDFNQQMKTLLGDDRYAKSQGLDDGTAAANLRQELTKVNPSDSQFQDLLKAQQKWNQRRSELDKQFQDDPSAGAYALQLKTLDAERDQEYERVLGTNMFDSLQKTQDGGYSKMKKYEAVWGLDDAQIDYVYGTMKYYERNAQDYQNQAKALEAQGQQVDWEAVNKNLQQFTQQTQQTLQNYLGGDRFDRLRQNGVFQFDQNQLPHRGAP